MPQTNPPPEPSFSDQVASRAVSKQAGKKQAKEQLKRDEPRVLEDAAGVGGAEEGICAAVGRREVK